MKNLAHDSTEIIHGDTFIDEFKNMVWNGFFYSKKRGVAFHKHFPIDRMNNSDFFYLYRRDKLIGGVCIVPCNKNQHVGIVSLVYIEEAFRGQGLLDKILKAAIKFSHTKYIALTLWTNKSYLYEKYGFNILDSSFCIKFENLDALDFALIEKNVTHQQQLIPAFSKSIDTYHKGDSCVVITSNIDGSKSICRYSGEVEDIVDIIMSCKGIIICNFPTKDETMKSIKRILIEKQIGFKEYKPMLQMWLGSIKIEKIETYDLLDRL
ncbi:GNAT family N-acetyltransferase [Vibrio tapetis]|uniref:N-acetyltransferase domain-containing protein n=1 Tax=Vibrio tapetis subsp. tapetis TaxID=1671868 RepID=A0A2N8ZGH1_9VIBR|nr:GNAT family N-acetyltransferase [Vibrio tapetis]SON51013.1 protein of unknown function [Vibrio tapetis subsp. tapetis]